MVVPVSLSPDRREQVLTRDGWVHYTETREYREKERKQRNVDKRLERFEQKHQEKQVRQGFSLVFSDEDVVEE